VKEYVVDPKQLENIAAQPPWVINTVRLTGITFGMFMWGGACFTASDPVPMLKAWSQAYLQFGTPYKPPYPLIYSEQILHDDLVHGHFWDTCIIHTESFLCDKKNYVRQKAMGPWIICLLVVASAAASAVTPAIHFVNIFSHKTGVTHYTQLLSQLKMGHMTHVTHQSINSWLARPMTHDMTAHQSLSQCDVCVP